MLAGVGPVPAVLLVVAADEGWMPQTAEHVDALVALGVRHGLLVVTRSDLMEPELARRRGPRAARRTPRWPGSRPCAVSAATGAGMAELRAALDDARRRAARGRRRRRRAAVGRPGVHDPRRGHGRHRHAGGGPDHAWTTSWSSPPPTGRRRVTVRGLQSLGATVSRVRGVARVAVNLRGVPREAVARGRRAAHARTPGSPSRRWTAACRASRWAPERRRCRRRCPRS